jgi:hypothetical protein
MTSLSVCVALVVRTGGSGWIINKDGVHTARRPLEMNAATARKVAAQLVEAADQNEKGK